MEEGFKETDNGVYSKGPSKIYKCLIPFTCMYTTLQLRQFHSLFPFQMECACQCHLLSNPLNLIIYHIFSYDINIYLNGNSPI